MEFSQFKQSHWALLAVLVGLVGLSWAGTLDAISSDYVNDSILDAGIIYGTARGINALVSALQGTELDLWLVTFSIGELLDPVNDMIERFSGVMTFAITSLVIQKLLLAIVSDAIFSAVLTALAAAAVAVFLLGKSGSGLLRAFIAVAFLRFSLAIVVAANLWVDHTFLPTSADEEHAIMEEFYADLQGVESIVRGEGKRSDLADHFETIQDKLDVFIDGTLRLLGSIVLKAVIIPVLFLYVLVQAGRSLFRMKRFADRGPAETPLTSALPVE